MKSYSDLLDVQVKSFQLNLPKMVNWRGKKVELSDKEKMAAGRAVWFIIKKGWGISTATLKVSGSFRVSEAKIERAVRAAFPENYFINFAKAKNSKLAKQMDDDQKYTVLAGSVNQQRSVRDQ